METCQAWKELTASWWYFEALFACTLFGCVYYVVGTPTGQLVKQILGLLVQLTLCVLSMVAEFFICHCDQSPAQLALCLQSFGCVGYTPGSDHTLPE